MSETNREILVPNELKNPDQNTYEAYCGQVIREDNIINNRLSWLLTMEGLLFSALAIIATAKTNSEVDETLVKALKQCIPIIGIVAPISALWVNLYSYQITKNFLKDWNKIKQHFPYHPSPFGGLRDAPPGLVPSTVLPVSIITAWIWIILSF